MAYSLCNENKYELQTTYVLIQYVINKQSLNRSKDCQRQYPSCLVCLLLLQLLKAFTPSLVIVKLHDIEELSEFLP